MWVMPSRVAALCCAALVLLAVVRPARAWIENHVLSDDVRIEVEASGKALVEHRVTLKTTGSERLRKLTIRSVDRDAIPASNSYVVPARDALSNSLDSATPLSLRLVLPKPKRRHRSAGSRSDPSVDEGDPPPAELEVSVDSDRGLRRGTYVFVVRYRTDLRARGLLQRDGAMVEVRWTGPEWEDGFDNARVLFVVPAAPTAPRSTDDASAEDPAEEDAVLAPRFLSEVRRGSDADEVELLRSYAPKGERIVWAVRVDQRALDPLPQAAPVAPARAYPPRVQLTQDPVERGWLIGCAAALFLIFTLLVLVRARQVARFARQVGAVVRPWIPLPVTIRAVLAGITLVAGVAMQLLFDRALPGAGLVLCATALAAHGAARVDPRASMRGPGRWLSISEGEALGKPVAPIRASLDAGTGVGRLLLLLLFGGVGAGAWAVWTQWDAPLLGVQVALDSVVLLAIFGTGRLAGLPADLAVEPIPFYRKLAARIRRMKAGRQLKIVPRLRIPAGQVDPDELRLLIVPSRPRPGFAGIEVGVTYALGFGARVAMPEVLLRVAEKSPAEQAIASLAVHGRTSRGRKPGQRVVAFAPRLPTVRMTAEIVVALAARVSDPGVKPAPGVRPEPRGTARRKAKAAA